MSTVCAVGGQTAGMVIMEDGDADGILDLATTCGIDCTAMMSWSGPVNADSVAGNAIVARAMARYPGRVLGLCTVDPSYMSQEEMQTEFHRCHLEHGMVGMKPYMSMGFNYDDPVWSKWWEFGNQHGM